MSLSEIRKGFSFLLRFTVPNLSSGQTVNTEFLQSKKDQAKRYRTKVYTCSKSRKAVLLFHGMGVLGIDDPRLIELASNLCISGFTVFTPELEEVKNLKIRIETVENIRDIVLSLDSFQEKYPFEEGLGFFSVSFGAGLGLIALSDGEIQKKFSSMCVVGGFANFEAVVPHVLEHFETENYGNFILLHNFIHMTVTNSEKLESVLWEAAMDNALNRKNGEAVAPKLQSALNSRDKEIFERICKEKSFRKALGEEIRESAGLLLRDLSPIHYIKEISIPVSIIHGRNDYVIPETESMVISKQMSDCGIQNRLEITSLLSHGDKVSYWRHINEIPGLAEAFGYFLIRI